MARPSKKITEKKSCPVTFDQFEKAGETCVAVINSNTIVGTLKEFSTGSFGYNLNGKILLDIGGKQVPFQVTGNIIAIGSKPE